jgi:hypothetical protein
MRLDTTLHWACAGGCATPRARTCNLALTLAFTLALALAFTLAFALALEKSARILAHTRTTHSPVPAPQLSGGF